MVIYKVKMIRIINDYHPVNRNPRHPKSAQARSCPLGVGIGPKLNGLLQETIAVDNHCFLTSICFVGVLYVNVPLIQFCEERNFNTLADSVWSLRFTLS